MKLLLHFVLTVSAIVVVVAYDEQFCRVERRSDMGLAEYRPGALNLRVDYDTGSAEECFQRCCDYKDDAGNHCNAASYYDDWEYAVCLLLSCVPLDSCVWMQATNFTTALVLQDIDAVNQSAAWNQSTVTSQGSLPSPSTPSVSPDLQDWNVINADVPSQMAVPVPNPDSAAVPDGTSLSNNGSSNGTLSEGTAQDAWNVFGLDPGNTNSTSDGFTDNGLADNSTIPDSDNDWNVVDTGILSDNEQPTNSTDNGQQQQQQQQQPVVNPSDGLQDGGDDFWSIFGAEDDQFWSEEDDESQSNKTIAGTEDDQSINDLEQPFNEPEQPFNQPGQPFNQPEQSVNQPEQPQQAFDDVRVTEDNLGDWQMGNEETPPHEDNTKPAVGRIPIPSLGIIIGLCSALGVAFLVLIAVCRKVYRGQEWPKYKPLRSDYDIRNEPSSSSSALLP